MGRYLVVNSAYELTWTHGPKYLHEYWNGHEYVRLDEGDDRTLCEVIDDPENVTQLISLGVSVTERCVESMRNLDEAAVAANPYDADEDVHDALEERGVNTHWHGSGGSGGFWAESVAELGVGLTISALRRIPQKRQAMTKSLDPWNRETWEEGPPEYGGVQTTEDDPFYTHGTIADKRVRAVGVGNIGSRYLDYVGTMGADVSAYDPYVSGSAFHRIGATQIHHLDELFDDTDIFAPLLPVTPETTKLIDRDRIYSLPEGCLLVLITRAAVVDMEAVRERVLNDEIALAVDVYDEEPLSVDDPLLGRHNVVHTPHVGGLTEYSNKQWARMLLARFRESGVSEEPY